MKPPIRCCVWQVHIWIGGLLDCEETYVNMAKLVGTNIAHKLAMLSFINRKNLYRDGVFKCASTAVSDHESLRMNETSSSSVHSKKARRNASRIEPICMYLL